MGDDFLKYYVCIHNKWNPYSIESKSLSSVYWVLAFKCIQVEKKLEWENIYLPLAELIGQLTHPEIFSEYRKIKDRHEKLKVSGSEFYKESNSGIEGGGTSNAHYDPELGLVDNDRKVIVPKEDYDSMIGIDGVAISF